MLMLIPDDCLQDSVLAFGLHNISAHFQRLVKVALAAYTFLWALVLFLSWLRLNITPTAADVQPEPVADALVLNSATLQPANQTQEGY